MRRMLTVLIMAVGVLVIVPFLSLAGEPPTGPETITKEARETIEATREYTAQQKEAFQRKAHEELSAVQKKIIVLHGKVGEASVTTRAGLQKSIAEVEKKKGVVKNKLDELRSATDEKWSDVKSGVSSALDELNRSFQRVRDRLP